MRGLTSLGFTPPPFFRCGSRATIAGTIVQVAMPTARSPINGSGLGLFAPSWLASVPKQDEQVAL
jgi:hypothetical protein